MVLRRRTDIQRCGYGDQGNLHSKAERNVRDGKMEFDVRCTYRTVQAEQAHSQHFSVRLKSPLGSCPSLHSRRGLDAKRKGEGHARL